MISKDEDLNHRIAKKINELKLKITSLREKNKMGLFAIMKITRWDKQHKPTAEELEKILIAEGTHPYVWVDEPGTYYGNHSHPFDEIRWIVSGKMRYGVGNEEFILGPGDRLDLPAGTIHWAKVEGDEPVVYLCASK